MKTVYLIELANREGLPTYYAPGRNNGSGPHSWTQEKGAALGFGEEHDAQMFIDALMPRMANTLRPVPYGRA